MNKLIVGIILLLSIMLLAGCESKQVPADASGSAETGAPGADTNEAQPTGESGETAGASGATKTADAGEEGTGTTSMEKGNPEGVTEGMCGIEALITKRSCSATVDLTTVDVMFENTGKGDLDGVVLKVLDSAGDIIGETSDMAAFPVGEKRSYTVDLSAYEGAKTIDAFPVSSGVLCINQKGRFNPSSCI